MAIITLIFNTSNKGEVTTHNSLDFYTRFLDKILTRKKKMNKVEGHIKSETCRALQAILKLYSDPADLTHDTKMSLVEDVKKTGYSKIPKVRSIAKNLLNFMYQEQDDFREIIDDDVNKELQLKTKSSRKDIPKFEIFKKMSKDKLEKTGREMKTEVFYKPRKFEEDAKSVIDIKIENLRTNHDDSESKELNTDSESKQMVEFKHEEETPQNAVFQIPNKGEISFRNTSLANVVGSRELKRGLFVIDQPLESMVKGKGWGANIRGLNYLKKQEGMNPSLLKGGQSPRELSLEELKQKAILEIFNNNKDAAKMMSFEGFQFEDFVSGEMSSIIANNESLKNLKKLTITEDGKIVIKGIDGKEQVINIEKSGLKIEVDKNGDKFIVNEKGERVELGDPNKGIPVHLDQDGKIQLGFPDDYVSSMRNSSRKLLNQLTGLTQSQMRLKKMREKSKEKRSQFKKMMKKNIKDSKKNPGKKISKFTFLDREQEYGRMRRLRKINQGVDPDATTPTNYETDFNDSFHDQFHKNHDAKKKAMGKFGRKKKKKALGSDSEVSSIRGADERIGRHLKDMDDTMLCPKEEAEKIAIEMMIERYLKDGVSASKLKSSHIWLYVLKLIKLEDYTKAYELLFLFGDDIYFLRACLICGASILPRVHKRTGSKILKKICEIKLGGKIPKCYLGFIEKGVKTNVLDLVDYETSFITVQALEEIASQFNHALRSRALYLVELTKEIIKYN